MCAQAEPARLARYAAQLVREEPGPRGPELLVRRPDGLVLLVPPGNSPTINASCLFSILLPGNAVIARAPARDRGVRLLVEDVLGGALEEAGMDRALAQVLTIGTRPFLDALLGRPEPRTLVFFGNTRVGEAVAERCRAAGKKVVLELEGSDHMMIWRDAPLERVVDSALRAFDFSTQPCAVPKHLLVHGARFDELVAALERRLPEVSVTIARDPERGVLAPVARREDYFACLDEVAPVAELRGGGPIDADGEPDPEGIFIAPTLALLDAQTVLTRPLRLFEDEISFPLLPIVRCDGARDEDALAAMLKIVGGSPFGLRASLWSEDAEVIERCVEELAEVGLLVVNGDHCEVPGYASPWGGPGRSGGPGGESHLFWEKTSRLQAITLDPASRRAALAALGVPDPSDMSRSPATPAPDAGEPLTLTLEDGVATLTLRRPARHNAVNPAMQRALLAAARELQRRQHELRCVVIRGAGRSFCSGADLHALRELDPDAARRFMLDATWAFRALERLPAPVIAAVHGYCLGGGFELLLHCDEVIAAESARLGLPEANLGLVPTTGAIARLIASVGELRARELVMSARALTAAEAQQFGLLTLVVPDAALDDAVAERVRARLAQPREGLAAVKRLFASGRRHAGAWIHELETFDALTRGS
ncbi:MAG: aldehyde dehydrogenase family protein [Myxococcales bacterium]|nr:aldehyde dehydrogenase family protein [Myxococcales bacterium]